MSYLQSNVTKKSYYMKRSMYSSLFESHQRLCIFIGEVLKLLLDIGFYVNYYRFRNIFLSNQTFRPKYFSPSFEF